jgi:replicative DNA helicase
VSTNSGETFSTAQALTYSRFPHNPPISRFCVHLYFADAKISMFLCIFASQRTTPMELTGNNTRKGNFRTNTPKPETMYETGGRLAPRDTEVEEAVLGALMLEKDAYTTVCDLLKPESFYDPKHQLIYTAIQQLGASQQPIDMLTVTERLRANGDLEKSGGPVYISGLTAKVASGAHVEFHARIVAQKYLARELINFASSIEGKAFDESNDVDDLLQEAEGKLFEISQRNVKKDVTQIDPIIKQAIEQIELAANRETGLSGLETQFHELDKLTSGWQNSDLIIIAARPAMGKTAFVLSMAKNMAVNVNIPVAIFSLEMSNLQLVNRLISNVCELEGEKIKSGRLTDNDWDKLMSGVKSLYSAPLYIDDTPSLSIFELRTKARRLVREHQVKIIIIDYLQLMNASGMKFGSREQEVSMISRSLKQLAKELNIPIIALSQLNRSVESRGTGTDTATKRPQLSDLRESGAIEQDADIVCFIHRPEYYLHSNEDAEGHDIRGLALFIVAKHRSGKVDDVKLRFVDRYARFQNWDEGASVTRGIAESKLNSATATDSADPFNDSSTPFTGGSADISGDSAVPF